MLTVREQLTHVYWLGGAPDSGKSTISQNLADRHGWCVMHYDQEDARQVEQLSQTVPEFRQFLNASLEDRWVNPTPQELFEFLLITFPRRFDLLVEQIRSLPAGKTVMVEGFGLLPELVNPLLSSPYQALWFVPTPAFKWKAMTRRGKPSFAAKVSDPHRAKVNVFERDQLLAEYYRQQVSALGLTMLEIDGALPPEEVTRFAEQYFGKYLPASFTHGLPYGDARQI